MCEFWYHYMKPKYDDNVITSEKRKRAERRFVDFKITLMLHCGNEFRMEVCSFRFKFDDIVPRKGKIISSSFFGAVKYTCFGT